MKRCFFLLLFALLCGCTSPIEPPDETTDPGATTEASQPVVESTPVLEFCPEAPEIASATANAVHAYDLDGGYDELLCQGDTILAVNTEGTAETVVLPLAGKSLAKGEIVTLCGVGLTAGSDQLAYYDRQDNAVVLLDDTLSEIDRVAMPEEMTGQPVLGPDLKEAYYLDHQGLRALDLATGLSRMLRQLELEQLGGRAGKQASLTGICADGTWLRLCQADGEWSFVSTVTGQQHADVVDGDSWSHFQYWQKDDGILHYLFSTDGKTQRELTPLETGTCIPMLKLGGLLFCYDGANGAVLDYYDLTSGNRTASVTLPGQAAQYGSFLAHQEKIWFRNQQDNLLYCWELGAHRLGDTRMYTGPRYTAQNPDLEGLKKIQSEAEQLSETYGVQVLIWKQLDMPELSEINFQIPYQTSLYQTNLDRLTQVLKELPKDFLPQTHGNLKLGLVLNLETEIPSGGLTYWTETGPVILLEMGQDLGEAFYHQLSYVIDNRIFAKTQLYDRWSSINPDAFQYSPANAEQEDSAYLNGEDPVFLSAWAMTSGAEDRASIFQAAVRQDSQTLFDTETLQKKLGLICDAIRRAYDLEQNEALPWEQYRNQ